MTFADRALCGMLLSEAAAVRFLKRNFLKSSEVDLGGAVFDAQTGRLLDRSSKEIRLRHLSGEVLGVLVRHRGEVVTRADLVDAVWKVPNVSDDSIAHCVAEIRRALGDADKRIVETVPREGYRLVPPARAGKLPLVPVAALVLVALVLVAGATFRLGEDGPVDPQVIAVLPFEDFSAAPNKGRLSDAVSESIITALARNPQLTVISRRSSFQFRESGEGVSEIARRLGADFVLEGSQVYDGSRLRITAQLIDAASEAHIWTDEMDVPLEAMLKANHEISSKIASAVGQSVVDTAEAQMSAGDVSALLISNAAQSRILRNYNRENLEVNLREQEQAMRDFPGSAWGYLGQALAIRNGLRHGWIEGDEDEIRQRMFELAKKGIALDPNNFMAHHAMGRVLMFNRDVEAATGAFRRGVELNPSSTLVLQGLTEALLFLGDTDEAFEWKRTASPLIFD